MHETHRRLRQATATHHARLDATLGGGFATRNDYAAYLRGMQGFVADADVALGGDAMTTRLHAWLRADCDALDLSTDLSDPDVTRADAAARLGWEYVVTGSSLGARFLLREVRALGFDTGRGASFLAGHAAGDDWLLFLRRLADSEAAPLKVCGGAIDAFLAAERRMRAAREEVA
jgi:heme oxygenase